jgi:hypothetical protein
MMRWLPAWALLILISTASASEAPAAYPTDPRTGLVMAPGWELVSAHCGACHSHRLVTAQRGDADFWRSVIRWMQKTQNLWEIPPAQEQVIIEYLASNYNESDWGRRPPLPASLMPPEAAAR